ncbi:MAG TPA: hypothetical protein VK783_00950 [Bacteroidia bacterium]|jgi:hypothetical protein|nr:hypothetical protein [Bacteroidia bacterium]
MTEKERELIVREIRKKTKKALKSKKSSILFLVNAGLLTKNGKVSSRYKNLCIPQEQI